MELREFCKLCISENATLEAGEEEPTVHGAYVRVRVGARGGKVRAKMTSDDLLDMSAGKLAEWITSTLEAYSDEVKIVVECVRVGDTSARYAWRPSTDEYGDEAPATPQGEVAGLVREVGRVVHTLSRQLDAAYDRQARIAETQTTHLLELAERRALDRVSEDASTSDARTQLVAMLAAIGPQLLAGSQRGRPSNLEPQEELEASVKDLQFAALAIGDAVAAGATITDDLRKDLASLGAAMARILGVPAELAATFEQALASAEV